MKNIKRIIPYYFICFTVLFSAISPVLSVIANAAENVAAVSGKIFELDDNSDFELKSDSKLISDNSLSLGKLSVTGEFSAASNKNGVTAYEVKDEKLITISYKYNDALVNAPEKEWHLYDDGRTRANGINLGNKVGKGAIILQTSLNREKWTTDTIVTNFTQSADNSREISFDTNDIQLLNGCYYRVTVVYRVERKLDPTAIIGFIPYDNNFEHKKVAEVFEFYAEYSEKETSAPSNEKKYSLGSKEKKEANKGYTGIVPIDVNDPHYNWDLGNFFVSGFTDRRDNVLLKNVGDKITLWFNLKQDIDALNGNKNLIISEDTDGYDRSFEIPKTNFKRGTLIIQHTNYEGIKSKPQIYTNYLEALTSPSADNKVRLFEEGDYEVALDYEVKTDALFNNIHNYRISFSFKVRNSNCMFYPLDIKNHSELKNGAITENGFYIDMAKSRYLTINVKHSKWTKGADGYVEDVRANGSANENSRFIEEGIYTVEVKNPTTGESTEKKIYVGSDSVLMAYAVNPEYTIPQIVQLVNSGAKILPDGTIVLPVSEPASETVSTSETSEPGMSSEVSSADNESEQSAEEAMSENAEKKSDNNLIIYVLIGAGAALIIGIIIILAARKSKLSGK